VTPAGLRPGSTRSGSPSSSSCSGCPATSPHRELCRVWLRRTALGYSARAGRTVCAGCSAGALVLSADGLSGMDVLLHAARRRRFLGPDRRGAREVLAVIVLVRGARRLPAWTLQAG
jgi:hypothetical protein